MRPHTRPVKCTYASRPRPALPTVPSDLTDEAEPTSSPAPKKRKHLSELSFASLFNDGDRPAKKSKLPTKKSSAQKSQPFKPALTQMFLATATSLRTCPTCQLSYTRGAPDDEALHRSHCARVKSGMEWGREEARSEGKEVQVARESVLLKGKKERGRILTVRADIGGKVGAKVSHTFTSLLVHFS